MWKQVAIDNAKALVPFKQSFRRLLRTYRPYTSLEATDRYALEQGLDLVRLIGAHGLAARNVLEVGTGWMPVIPHLLTALGAERVVLSDIERLADARTAEMARRLVAGSLRELAVITGVPVGTLQSNLDRRGVLQYRCPPRFEAEPDASFDLIYSRTVLEHIPPENLNTMLWDCRRLLRPGGACIHVIDNSDHFQHRDKRMSRLNFLTVSDLALRIACLNRQNFQNRMRHSDYVRMFQAHGYILEHVEGRVDEKALADLKRLKLQPRFRSYTAEDLATLTSVIVARPGASARAGDAVKTALKSSLAAE